MISFRSLAMACLVSAPLVAAPAQMPAPVVKQENVAAAQLAAFTKYTLGGSATFLTLGLIAKNDVLMGLGLGGLGGVATGILQKNTHWLIVWLGEALGRDFVAKRICSKNPEDMELTPEERAKAEKWIGAFVNAFNKNKPEARRNQMIKEQLEDAEPAMLQAKAYNTILNTGRGASWISYLVYRYLEKKAEQQA